jgi:ribosomal protein S18 acetylase RimI-like enzyme
MGATGKILSFSGGWVKKLYNSGMKASSWVVRPPQLADVVPLAAIATAVSAGSRQAVLAGSQQAVSAPITSTQISQTVQQANGRFWTITQAEQPIGFATLLPIPGLPHHFDLVGSIEPTFQRQGAGSFLWQHIREAAKGMAVHKISHTVSDLSSPAACFLQQHHFTLAHEEWTMVLDSLPATSPPPTVCLLQKIDRETAVRTLPSLYQHCFANTPWFQPYTPDEVIATWKASDQLHYLLENKTPIGFIWLHFSKSGQIEIEPIGIVPEKQGMGYGRFLLTATLNKLPARQRQPITLGVWRNNHKAVHLYKSVGFRHVSSSTILTFTLPQT